MRARRKEVGPRLPNWVSKVVRPVRTVAREHAEAAAAALRGDIQALLDHELGDLRRQMIRDLRRMELLLRPTSDLTDRERNPSAHQVPSEVSDILYSDLEDRFRGSAAEIRQRQSEYLPMVRQALGGCESQIVLDIGSGRGEWLQLLADEGVSSCGVDGNEIFVAECAERGLSVTVQDVLEHLGSLPDGQFAVVTMFHIVEHLSLDYLAALLIECLRVLDPQGVLIIETPNCRSLTVAASTFWIDPTHPRPLHPEVLGFLVERAGFRSVEPMLLHEIGPEGTTESELADVSPLMRSLATTVFGFGDFALIARP